ncbi:DUF4142 domain-containing protein [soil metagenome]
MNNYIKVFTIAVLISMSACGPKKNDAKEQAEEQNEAKFDDTRVERDAEFAVAAADGGLLEVELGKLAQSNAASTQVKSFGKMMMDDHSKANAELKTLAASKGIQLPAVLSEKNQKKFNDLADKSGKDFDDAYTDFMVKDHKEDIDEFQKEAEKGRDPELKSWAAGKVAVLEHHLQMAKQAEEAVDNMK